MSRKCILTGRHVVMLSFGIGIFIGGSLTFVWVSRQLRHQVQRILIQISELEKKLDSIKVTLQENERKIQVESCELSLTDMEDDIFEEACDGSEDEKINSRSAFFELVDKLLDGNEDEQHKANKMLKAKFAEFCGDVEFMWRLCKSTFLLFQTCGPINKDMQKALIYEALNYAKSALELDNSCANAHKWYAITLGSTNDFESVSSKIKNGYHFKEHIKQAIILNPEDPSMHYLLGRWCYGVYMLSWFERKVASTLFSTPPDATIDECLHHFLKANELNPDKWKENMLFIAKCHVEKKNICEALRWLRKANNLPVITREDKKTQVEIETYLAKYV